MNIKKKNTKKLADRFTDTLTYRRFNVHEYDFDCTNNSRWSITECDYSASYIQCTCIIYTFICYKIKILLNYLSINIKK